MANRASAPLPDEAVETRSQARAYLALWLPRLATDRLRRARPDLAATAPLAAVRAVGSGVFVAAVDAAAAGEGVAPGATLASARALCPHLLAEPVDEAADAALLGRLAAWCDRYSPLVGTAGGDRILIEATGCAHLFGGPRAMLADALSRLRRAGFAAAGAYAPSPSAASALALYGPEAAVVAERAGLADALAPAPVAALRLAEEALEAEALEGLRRVGLRRLGDLYGLPRAALAARFGAAASALDRLLARARQPIAPRRPVAPHRVRLAFPDPIGLRGDIDAAVARLVERLCGRLQAEDLGCRRLELTACRADGTAQTLAVGTARPVRAAGPLLRLLAEKLGEIEPGFGIDCLILAAPRVERFESDQLSAAASGAPAPSDPEALAALCDRLANRLGSDNLFRLAPADSRLPDAAQNKRPPVERRRGSDEPAASWPDAPPRPQRLLARPQALQPLAAPKAGEPLLAFRLKGRRHAVRIAVGPERIAPDWWREDAAWAAGARDYWRVEDEAGRRFWIYRDGVAGPLADAAGDGPGRQHWFLHGIFD